jgi:serine/threonine-protein kinase
MSETFLVKSPLAPGDVVVGKYRVERVIGTGGMGVVVAARHLDLDQLVALKFILPHALAGKGNVERFMREARAAVRLKSEHVARVYDVGRDGEDRPFMVLELLEGMDLSKLNKQKGPLAVADSVEYVLQACEALVEAHASGIVHRDLKPQNMFVTRRLNGTPLVKVLDFGIAKEFGPGAIGQMALTDSAAIIGSPLYMAPEQMRSARTAEIRSDIWALGVILYELLGGQAPFDGETVTEVCIRVVNEEPTSLLSLRPGLDPALVAIVMRCLAKEPEGRYHNVAALAAALEPFSRSAKQGGPVRPWRSFEDTQDSPQGGGNPFASGASGASRSSAPSNPDATAPSTAVTIKTLDDIVDLEEFSEDVKRARALAGSTQASAGSGKAGARRANASSTPPLVSTDVAWGDAGSRAPAGARPARTFSTGMVVGLVAAAAVAAAAAGLFFGRGSTGALAGGTAATSPNVNAPSAVVAPPSAPVPAPPVNAVADPAQTPLTVASGVAPASPTPATPAGRLVSGGKTPRGARTAVAASEAAAAASTARPAEARPAAAPVSPNGAPILH